MKIRLIRNIWEPAEMIWFLVTTNVILFITALLFFPGAVNLDLNPMLFLSPPTGVLYKLGASGTLPVFAEDRWWTLITANYLHGSLLHLVFNVFALGQIGTVNSEIYPPSRLFLIYSVGGVFSMAVSTLAGIPLTLGASGAICALIGSMSYHQWRVNRGDPKRQLLSVGGWIVLLAGYGLLIPNVNNWAHGAGFIAGFTLGVMFWAGVEQRESRSYQFAALACMLLTVGCLIWGLLFS